MVKSTKTQMGDRRNDFGSGQEVSTRLVKPTRVESQLGYFH